MALKRNVSKWLCKIGWHGPWLDLSIDPLVTTNYQCQSCFLMVKDKYAVGLHGLIVRTWRRFHKDDFDWGQFERERDQYLEERYGRHPSYTDKVAEMTPEKATDLTEGRDGK